MKWEREAVSRKEHIIQRLTQERDQATAIAATKEVSWPPNAPETVETQVWEERWYRDHPSTNLEALRDDLERYKGQEVLMDVTMHPRGGWLTALHDAWGVVKSTDEYGRTKKASPERLPAGKGWFHFEGPTDRVLQSLQTLLMDDDSGFVQVTKRKDKDPKKVWKDADSAVGWKVTLRVREQKGDLSSIPVHIREVAIVQLNEIETVVEKPIFVSVPEGQEANLCGHTAEELRGMVKDVLAREKAEEEVEALGGVTGFESIPASERDARRRRSLAAKQTT